MYSVPLVKIIIYITLTLASFYTLGYTFIDILKWFIYKNKEIKYNIKTDISLSLSLGLIISVLILYFISLIKIFNITPFLFIFSLAYIIIKNLKNKNMYYKIKSSIIIKKYLPLIIFWIIIYTIIFYIIIDILNSTPLTPLGDIINGHAPMTALMLKYKLLPLDTKKYKIIILYPPGLSVLSAFYSMFLDLPPLLTVFLIGAIILIINIALIFRITSVFLRTQNDDIILHIMYYSIMVIYIFIILPNTSFSFLERSLFGNFINTTYPSFLGFTVFFTINLLILYDFIYNDTKIIYTLITLVLFSLLIIYPPMFSLALIYIILSLFINKNNVLKKIYYSIKIISIIILIFLIFFFLSYIIGNFNNIYEGLSLILKYITGTYSPKQQPLKGLALERYRYTATLLSDFIPGTIIIFFADIIAILYIIYYIVMKKARFYPIKIFILLFYFVINSIIFNSIFNIYPLINAVFIAKRLYVLQLFYSFLIIIMFFNDLNNYKKYVVKLKFNKLFLRLNINIIVTFIFIIIIIILFYKYLIIFHYKRLLWYKPNINDINAVIYIKNNINDKDLILNDATWISLSIQGFEIKNLTFWMWNWNTKYNYTIKVWNIWNNIDNSSEFYRLLLKYNISYIFVSSEKVYLWRAVTLHKLSKAKVTWHYYKKTISIKKLDNMPFLKKIYAENNTRIYKVIRMKL